MGRSTNTTVYRIQDADGRGPWKPGFSHHWVQTRPDHDNLIPWVKEFGRVDLTADPLLGVHYCCACLSVEQLHRWFTPLEYIALIGFGYQAVLINDCNVLASSDTQCVVQSRVPFRIAARPFNLYDPSHLGKTLNKLG